MGILKKKEVKSTDLHLNPVSRNPGSVPAWQNIGPDLDQNFDGTFLKELFRTIILGKKSADYINT